MRVHMLLAIMLSMVSIVISYYLHSPETPTIHAGLKYSDLVYGVFNTRFNPGDPGLWFDPGKLELLKNGYRVCPVPYVDYKFEYPPLVGALFLISTCTSIYVNLPKVFDAREYGELIARVTLMHYTIQSIALGLALVVTVVLLAKLSKTTSPPSRALMLPLLPSTIVYTIYNWDMLAVMFLVASYYLYVRGSYRLSGLMMGLSIATKLLTGLAGLVLALRLAARGDKRGFTDFTLSLIVSAATPYLIVLLLSPRGFTEFINHHASWYCENCLYLPLIHDIWSPLHRVLAAFMIGFTTATILVASTRANVRLEELLLASVMAPILFNYVFSPQMMLMITPLALIALDHRIIPLYVVADTLNALIIVQFFNDLTYSNPWTLEGLTQKIAMARNTLLLAILTYLMIRIYNLKVDIRFLARIRASPRSSL